MAFIVVYDANVLYPNTLRDLLLRIAQLPHLVQAKWTDDILDEALGAVSKNHPDIAAEKMARLRFLMNEAVRDCLVEGIKAGAQTIVTRNLKHFPRGKLAPWGIRAKRRMISSAIRSTSTARPSTHVSNRLWIHGLGRRSRLRMCCKSCRGIAS